MQKLLKNWQIISSESIEVPEEEVSLIEYKTSGWFDAEIPGTIVGHLVEAGHYDDPYFGTNMKEIPGFKHGRTDHFAFHQMPGDSPFRKPFWYRTIVNIDKSQKEKRLRLKIDGINYRANLWVNGKRVAGDDHLIGSYRRFDIDITNFVKIGEDNCIAFELYAQRPDELGITFIDWGPVPPDDSMGIWQPVTLYTTELMSISDLYMRGKPVDNNRGEIEAFIELRNDSDITSDISLKLDVDEISVEMDYSLPPKSISKIKLIPEKYKELIIESPRLWWPHDMGTPELYNCKLTLLKEDEVVDTRSVTFGIRDITSVINEFGTRQYEVNGIPVLIRGAAWSPDLMLRQSDQQDEIDIAYVKNMNFNTIRFEGKFGSDNIWDVCDREGIMVLAGWPCCTHWEKWDEWKEGDLHVAVECLKSQLLRLRNHPSFITWFYGSDFPPPVNIEREYLKVLSEYCNNISAISNASANPSAIQGDTGVKMSGPYGYVPPDYWYKENMPGKADSFNTEAGPDVTIPKLLSLKKFIPAEELENGSPSWNFHCGLASFPDTAVNDAAINGRYGTSKNLEEYSLTSQVLGYEVWRAMFESYGKTFPRGGGMIGWMLNSGWPSMIWQLYDFYNRPVGGFFGSKKACEQIHCQYDYVDNAIDLCNYRHDFKDTIEVNVTLYNLSGEILFEKKSGVVPVNHRSLRVLELPKLNEITFLFIEWSGANLEKGFNTYWLPFEKDDYREKNSYRTWFTWPLKNHANLHALKELEKCSVKVDKSLAEYDDYTEIYLSFENLDSKIAFYIEAELDLDIPVLWNDNCITLRPNGKRELVGKIMKYANSEEVSTSNIILTSWNCDFKKEN